MAIVSEAVPDPEDCSDRKRQRVLERDQSDAHTRRQTPTSVDQCHTDWLQSQPLRDSAFGDIYENLLHNVQSGVYLFSEYSGMLQDAQAAQCIQCNIEKEGQCSGHGMTMLKSGDIDPFCQHLAHRFVGPLKPHCVFGDNKLRVAAMMKECFDELRQEVHIALATELSKGVDRKKAHDTAADVMVQGIIMLSWALGFVLL